MTIFLVKNLCTKSFKKEISIAACRGASNPDFVSSAVLWAHVRAAGRPDASRLLAIRDAAAAELPLAAPLPNSRLS